MARRNEQFTSPKQPPSEEDLEGLIFGLEFGAAICAAGAIIFTVIDIVGHFDSTTRNVVTGIGVAAYLCAIGLYIGSEVKKGELRRLRRNQRLIK